MAAVTVGRGSLATVNLVVAQGADNTFSFRYSETVEGVTTPVDLSGYTARGQLRDGVGRTLWLELDDISLDSGGVIQFSIPAATTEADVWNTRNTGVWDMELTSPAGSVVRFVSGSVSVSHDVTRDV